MKAKKILSSLRAIFFCSKIILAMQKIFSLIFSYAENIILKNLKILGKVAVELERGRPKNEIPRQKQLNLRLSDFEYEKILRVAKQKNITRTEAILRGIDLLERDKPKKFKNLSGNNKKISSGVVDGEVVMFNKK